MKQTENAKLNKGETVTKETKKKSVNKGVK